MARAESEFLFRHFGRQGFAWLALFGINILGILPWAQVQFPVVDLAETVYQVRRFQLGYVPYRDTFMHHFLGYILPFVALDSVVTLTPVVLKVVSLVFNFATAVALWLLLRDVAARSIAWLGAFLTVTVGWFWSWHGAGFNVQSYLAPLIAVVLYFAVRASLHHARGALAGGAFFAGVLLTFDQRAIVFALPLLVPLVFVRPLRAWKTVVLSGLAYLSAPACCLLLLWWAGAWQDFIEQTVLFPLFYRNQGVQFGAGPWLSTWFGSWLGGERVIVPLFLVGLVVALLVERRRSLTTIWILSFAATAVAVFAGGRPFRNYFLLLGPLTIVMVTLLPWYLRRWSAALGEACTIGLVAFGAFCALRPVALFAMTGAVTLTPDEHVVIEAAAAVARETSADDGVLVWGFAPQIYVLSNRFRAFRDTGLLSIAGGNFTSTSGEGRLPDMVKEFEEYLANTPPKVIVVYAVMSETCGPTPVLHNLDYERAAHLRNLRDLLATSYRRSLVVTGACERADVMVRRVD
jgi:hypothetical protein